MSYEDPTMYEDHVEDGPEAHGWGGGDPDDGWEIPPPGYCEPEEDELDDELREPSRMGMWPGRDDGDELEVAR